MIYRMFLIEQRKREKEKERVKECANINIKFQTDWIWFTKVDKLKRIQS